MSDGGDPAYEPYRLPNPEQRPRTDPPEVKVPTPKAVDPEDPFGPVALARTHLDALRAIDAARVLRRVARPGRWRADASWPTLRDALMDADLALSLHDDTTSLMFRREIAELLS